MSFITRRKTIEASVALEGSHRLKATLTWPHLVAMGVGAIVGTGIYTLTGVGAGLAGPSVVVSFLVCGAICASTDAGIPMSATETGPQWMRPGRRRCPGFLRKNVTVREALTAVPMTAPDVPLIPLGRSTARIGAGCVFILSIMARGRPSTGRSRTTTRRRSRPR